MSAGAGGSEQPRGSRRCCPFVTDEMHVQKEQVKILCVLLGKSMRRRWPRGLSKTLKSTAICSEAAQRNAPSTARAVSPAALAAAAAATVLCGSAALLEVTAESAEAGVHVYTFSAEDSSGNTAECSAPIGLW